ncbi:MBG domain-containing protein, partial [Nitrospirillum amazonense]|uniref:MBG domain-containing protein n=1 Tax=Nitrospirillum amazonense TaxID=28077 RepID=UPI002412E74C
GSGTAASVGSYTITASGATGTGLSNYSVSYADGTLTVNPAALTITASGASKTYGTSASLTGYSSSGLVNGDSVSAVTLASSGSGTAASVGSYSITASGATGTGLSNYSVSYADGTLTVNPAALTITASGASKTYGASASLTGDARVRWQRHSGVGGQLYHHGQRCHGNGPQQLLGELRRRHADGEPRQPDDHGQRGHQDLRDQY